MQYEIEKTAECDAWLKNLRDRKAVLAIAKRLDHACLGNFGDIAPIGGGVSEMRLFIGPGYRLYYTMCGSRIIIMPAGGDKSSQASDIKKPRPWRNIIR